MKLSALDELGLAITNAGYTWTPEMRKAYEKGIKKQWVGLTDDEIWDLYTDRGNIFARLIEAKLKEKNT